MRYDWVLLNRPCDCQDCRDSGNRKTVYYCEIWDLQSGTMVDEAQWSDCNKRAIMNGGHRCLELEAKCATTGC